MSDNKIFDRERMEKALNSEVHIVPEGLSRDELRKFIINVGESALQEDLSEIDSAYLDLLDSGIDKDIKLIPDEVWERVESLRKKAVLAQNNKSML
jgi:hypothetical protein|tara:strand:- start:1934 stop:2221 length:288 start_codon:yes stop_codon:yes gene_type:complete